MKYHVLIPEIHYISVIVEADSEDDAKSKAMDKLENSDTLDIEYSHTLEQDEWVVTNITKQSLIDEKWIKQQYQREIPNQIMEV